MQIAVISLLILAAALVPAGADTVRYYHLDGVGNVRAMTNEAGVVVERHDYLPYGEEWCPGPPAGLCGASPPGQPRRFTGKERDVETGLDYFGARYYGSNVTGLPVGGLPSKPTRAGETRFTAAGRRAHAEEPLPPGFERDVRLPSGKRMDGYNADEKQVIELKPNNPRAVRRGERQAEGYCRECDQTYGPGHTGRVQTYEPKKYLEKEKN
jgi:hypothetical protein